MKIVAVVFGDQVKLTKLCPMSEELAKVKVEFRKLFKYYGDFTVSRWIWTLNVWVECEDDDDVQDYLRGNEHNKFKMIPSVEYGLGNLKPESTAVFLCDVQERFASAISHFSEIVEVAGRILKGAELLNLPLVVTEQYPKGLLHTVKELDISRASLVAEKTKFSMLVPEVDTWLEENANIKSVVLLGVEAHVCVQQTVIDLHARGIEVHVVADATSSRCLIDRGLAYQRFIQLRGAFVSTAETVLFQLVADKEHPQFKAIQGLIKTLPPDTGLSGFKSNIYKISEKS